MSTVVTKNLTVNIEGEDRIVGANISVSVGELVLLLGANGSGKSSLLKGVMSLDGTTLTGDVLLDGETLTNQKTDEKARSGIFYSPQTTPSLEGVKLISLLYGAYTKISDAVTPMSIIDLRNHAIALAQKYGLDQTLLDRPIGVGLSGGEKKQSELLQLLVLKPKFALLDEVDSGVDIEMVQKIITIISDMKRAGTGVLLISHNMSLLETINPDKVYLTKKGEIIREGDASIIKDIQKNGF